MQRRKLSDTIVADVLAKISTGELDEGASLPAETAFASAYGVSRSVAREALRELAGKGFVDARQGATTLVAPRIQWNVLDPDFLAVTSAADFFDHLQEARELIEPPIASLAAARATPQDVARMASLTRDMESITDAEQHADLDIAFHETIASATQNPVLVSLHNSISNMARRTRVVSVQVPGAIERAAEWHRHLVDAIGRGDSGSADAAMRMHLVQVKSELAAVERLAAERVEPAAQAD